MSTILDDALDETKPPTGNALTADERAAKVIMNDQFERAKNDIEALEAAPPVHTHDHGALTGLADDDHTQYHTDARGDARYAPVGHVGDTGAAHGVAAAPSTNGFMTGADKSKLDGITPGAEPNTVDSVFSRTGAVVAAAGDYDGLYAVESTENETAGPLQLAVVATLPGTPDANTVYFVTT